MILTIQDFDLELFLKVHRGLSCGFLDWLAPLLRNKFFWSPLYLFLIIFLVREYKRKGWYMVGLMLFSFGLGDTVASRVIKPIVARIRPCNDFQLANLIIHRVPCGSGYSFPSSHATNHFAIAVFLIIIFYKSWKPVLPIGLIWAFLISMAQVYVGVHYPLDTLAGALLGSSIGMFTGTLYKRLQPHI
jgi:membrane-associated phospholipid phosphatase